MDAESLMSPWRCIYSDSNFNRSFWMITELHRNASLSFLCKLCKLTQWPSTDKYPTQLRVPLSLFSWRCLCGNSQEQYLCFCKMEKPHTLAFMSGVYRNQVCPEVKNKLVLECLLSCHHRWSYSLSLTDSIYTPLRGGEQHARGFIDCDRCLITLLQVEKKHKSFQELDRFMHYYTRFKNHEHSYQVSASAMSTNSHLWYGNSVFSTFTTSTVSVLPFQWCGKHNWLIAKLLNFIQWYSF